MYSLEEIIKMNNPEPGDYEKQVAENKKRNSKLTLKDISNWSYEKKQEELNKVFEGR